MKRISIKKPLWFIDNLNGDIYWFRKIKDDEIEGIQFPKYTFKANKGSWNKKDWESVIKRSEPERFKFVYFSKLTDKRRHNIIKGILSK